MLKIDLGGALDTAQHRTQALQQTLHHMAPDLTTAKSNTTELDTHHTGIIIAMANHIIEKNYNSLYLETFAAWMGYRQL